MFTSRLNSWDINFTEIRNSHCTNGLYIRILNYNDDLDKRKMMNKVESKQSGGECDRITQSSCSIWLFARLRELTFSSLHCFA